MSHAENVQISYKATPLTKMLDDKLRAIVPIVCATAAGERGDTALSVTMTHNEHVRVRSVATLLDDDGVVDGSVSSSVARAAHT
jgi:hypothetical protein